MELLLGLQEHRCDFFPQQLTGIMCQTFWDVRGIVLDSSCFGLASQRHAALLRCALPFYVGCVESMTRIVKEPLVRPNYTICIVCAYARRICVFCVGCHDRCALNAIFCWHSEA